ERCGVDQVANRLCLRQIEAAVEKGAEGEFAGIGQTRARSEGALDRMAQHDRRAVAGDLNQVLGGVGAGTFEERDDHLVDGGTLGVAEFGEMDMPGVETQGIGDGGWGMGHRRNELGGYFSGVGTGETYYTEPGSAGWRGDCDDGVVEGHGSSELR